LLNSIEEREKDPVTVKIVRILRESGHDMDEIRKFVRQYFSAWQGTDSHREKSVRPREVSLEEQIENQQRIVNLLAAQLESLRSGDRSFGEYRKMVRKTGGSLLRNAEIVKGFETEKSETGIRRKEQDYEALRHAATTFLSMDPSVSDGEIIEAMRQIAQECKV
jgi:DNA-binding transcriptional MerR regulator